MATLVTIAGCQCVAGLEWAALQADAGATQKDAVQQYIRKNGIQLGARQVNGTTTLIGAVNKVESDSSLVGKPSLADLVSQTIKTGIVILPIHVSGRELYWFCSFSDGSVRPGGDVIGRQDNILSQARDDLALLAPNGYHLYTTDTLATLISGASPEIVDPDALIPAGFPDAIRVEKLSQGVKPRTLAFGAIAAGLLALGVVGTMLVIKTHVHRQPTPAEIQAQQEAAFNASLHGTLAATLPQTSPAWIFAARDAVYQLPIRYAGYALTSAKCQPAGVCTLEWKATESASLPAFKAHFQKISAGDIVFPFDGGSALLNITFTAPPPPPQNDAWYQGIPVYTDFLTHLIVNFQNADRFWVPTGITRNGTDPTPAGGLGADPRDGTQYFTGTLHFSITQLFEMGPLIRRILNSPYVSFNAFEVAVNQNAPTLTLEISYVVKKPA